MAYDEANEREFAEAEEALADKRYSGWKRAQARKAADARFFAPPTLADMDRYWFDKEPVR